MTARCSPCRRSWTTLIERGWVGTKSGQGFYKKDASGEILTLDPASMTYRRRRAGSTAVARRRERRSRTRARASRRSSTGSDKVGQFLRDDAAAHAASTPRASRPRSPTPSTTWTARCSGALAGSWGRSRPGMRSASNRCSRPVTSASRRPLVRDALARGAFRQRRDGDALRTRAARRAGSAAAAHGEGANRRRAAQCRREPGRSRRRRARRRVPLEDERHRRRHDPDAPGRRQGSGGALPRARRRQRRAELLRRREPDAPAARSAGRQLGRDRPDGPGVSGRDDGAQVRARSRSSSRRRRWRSGGGCEVALHGDRVQAAAETYMGLVEVGVGLIPAGGGTKEMLARAMEGGATARGIRIRCRSCSGCSRRSASAKCRRADADAARLGYLRPVDGITMNRERLIADAKAVALARASATTSRHVPRTAIPVGGEGLQAALKLGVHLAWRAGRLSDHDALIGRTLARILVGRRSSARRHRHRTGAARPRARSVPELVRSAEDAGADRHTLKTGKTLRN